MMNKKRLQELREKYPDSLFVEVIQMSVNLIASNDNPLEYRKGSLYYLCANTPSGIKRIGRVSRNIFKWYSLVKMDSQPGFINNSWWKFEP